MAEQHDRRQIDRDKDKIMAAVKEAVDNSVKFAILTHKDACPIGSVKEQHDRMYKEFFNGDDGKSGFFAEMRTFATKITTRADDEDKRKGQSFKRKTIFWSGAGVFAVILAVLLAAPAQQAWAKIGALSDLANKASTIIKMGDDWQRYHEQTTDQTKDSDPQKPQPSPFKNPPKKPKKSFFQYDPSGVGLMKEPIMNSDLENLRRY